MPIIMRVGLHASQALHASSADLHYIQYTYIHTYNPIIIVTNTNLELCIPCTAGHEYLDQYSYCFSLACSYSN